MRRISYYFRTFFVLIALLSTMSVWAETRTGDLGDCIHYEWDTKTEKVRIYGEGPMPSFILDFRGSYIKTLDIEEGVTSIGNFAFVGCSELTSIKIPASVTHIREFAFQGCSALTSIVIPEGIAEIWPGAFSGCSALTSIVIPASVTSIREYAFSGCSAVTSIVVDSNNNIYDSRENCNAIIESATNTLVCSCSSSFIPNSVIKIGEAAFYGCSTLTGIEIPKGVTSIGRWAFGQCSALTSIKISASVTSIGDYAFSGCSSLSSFILLGILPPYITNDNTNGNTFDEDTKAQCNFYVPKDSRGEYFYSGWRGFNLLEYSDLSEIPALIDPDEDPAKYDLNGDSRVSTADVTKLVDYILKHPADQKK